MKILIKLSYRLFILIFLTHLAGSKAPCQFMNLTLLPASAEETLLKNKDSTAGNGRRSVPAEQYRIVFFGDSITAGFGVDSEIAYPAVIESLFLAKGLNVSIFNAGVSGDTTSNGLQRLEWTLRGGAKDHSAEVFVLALGSNDGLRGLSTQEMAKNLEAIVAKIKQTHPHTEIILVGAKAPPNMGHDYETAFSEAFPALAKKTEVALVPFLLEGVAGERELNQADGIHPNAAGHKKIANILLPYLEAANMRLDNKSGHNSNGIRSETSQQ